MPGLCDSMYTNTGCGAPAVPTWTFDPSGASPVIRSASSVGALLACGAHQQVLPVAPDVDALVGQARCELARVAHGRQVDAHLPLVGPARPAAPARPPPRAARAPRRARRRSGASARRRPSTRPRPDASGSATVSALRPSAATRSRATRSASRACSSVGRVEEHPRPVAGDDHPVAEALARLVVEVEASAAARRASTRAARRRGRPRPATRRSSAEVSHGRCEPTRRPPAAIAPRRMRQLASLPWRCRRPGS